MPGRASRAAIALVGSLLGLRLAVAWVQGIHGGAADYVSFATGAKVLAQSVHCLYCLSDQTTAQVLVLGYHPPPPAPSFPAPFVSPPPVAWLFQPLAALPLTTALPIYLALLAGAVVVSARVLTVALRYRIPDPSVRALVIVLGVGSLPGATSLLLGQLDPLGLLAATLAVFMVTRGHPAMAGVLLSCALMKPQLVWLAPVAFVAGGHRRAAAGFAAGSALWVIGSLLLIGPAGVWEWYRYVGVRLGGDAATFARGPAGFANAAGGGAGAVFAAGTVIALAMLGLIIANRERMRDPLTAVAMGVAASMACSPHLFSDDLMLLAIPIAVLAGRAPKAAVAVGLAVNASFLLDEYVLPARLQRTEGLVILALVVMVAVARHQRAREVGSAAPPVWQGATR